MPTVVRLSKIIDALEFQSDEYASYLDLDTGEVENVSDDLLRKAESDEEPASLPGWQKHEWEIAKRIVSTDRFEPLPTKHDIHEWAIMEEFSLSVKSDEIRDELLDAIHGRGAFRMFRNVIYRRHIEKDWQKFRDDALKEIATDWCEENGIEWK